MSTEIHLDNLKYSVLKERTKDMLERARNAHRESLALSTDPPLYVGGQETTTVFSDGRVIKVVVCVSLPVKEQEQNG